MQQRLLKDVQAGFDGDPAAKSKEEIISSYPGLFAIYVYRLAHLLYKEEVPYIPRIMTEYDMVRLESILIREQRLEITSLLIMVQVW